eukprot:5295751-Alexandrium_andersonii.AAC.1
MSASLVGSEMCIRDSPCAALGIDGSRRSLQFQLRAAGAPPEARRSRRACLLYTSDAADDM